MRMLPHTMSYEFAGYRCKGHGQGLDGGRSCSRNGTVVIMAGAQHAAEIVPQRQACPATRVTGTGARLRAGREAVASLPSNIPGDTIGHDARTPAAATQLLTTE